MKIIKLPHSFLFLRVNPKNDTVTCFFIFFVSWLSWTSQKIVFDLKLLPLKGVKEFYKALANDYTTKYRL